ncbi:MAG: hypothetical protein H3C47_00960 [Candidatus Cloacimonetes bacterium]|nr:hypothetical protein [Candidatus Cloacimonadota bacterium]
MRWFLALYAMASMALSVFGFVYFYGFNFDGVPLGYFNKERDISGMHFQELVSIKEAEFSRYRTQSFLIRGGERDVRLEFDRGWFVRLDKKKLADAYRNMLEENPIWVRAFHYLRLDFPIRQFTFEPELDEVRTRQSLERFFTKPEVIDKLLKAMAPFVSNNIKGEVVLSIRSA